TESEVTSIVASTGCGPIAVADPAAAATVTAAFGGTPPLDPGTFTTPAFPRQFPRHADPDLSEDEVALVLLTSGTTGTPKPVPLSHRVLAARVRSFAPAPATSAVISIVCVPFHHVAGLIGILVGLAGGNTSVLQPRFDAGEWLTLVGRHRVQRVFLVPAMLQRIMGHPGFARADLSSLQMFPYRAAPAS